MLVLAGEIVFTDRPPDTVEHLERLAVRVQGLAVTACEASGFQDHLDPVLLVLLGDCREAENFPLLLAEDVADEVVRGAALIVPPAGVARGRPPRR